MSVLMWQPREFGLATFIVYEVDGEDFVSPAYNATIEITEPSGSVSGEAVFLGLLATALLGLAGMWAYTQLQKISKVSQL